MADETIPFAAVLREIFTPRPDRRGQLARSGVVHVERQNTGLCGFATRCGKVFDPFDVDETDAAASCLVCVRSAPPA